MRKNACQLKTFFSKGELFGMEFEKRIYVDSITRLLIYGCFFTYIKFLSFVELGSEEESH
jgi:hypothetical protein